MNNILKCLYKDPWGYGIVNIETCELKILDEKEIRTLLKTQEIEGVTKEGRKLSVKPIDHNKYTVNATIDLEILVFFNRLSLELKDIPHDVERLVDCVYSNTKFTSSSGGSHSDYAYGLASDYNKIQDKLPPEEFYNVYYNKPSKFTEIFNEFQIYSKSRNADDDYYNKLLELTGLPVWYKPLLKNVLYSLH